MAVNRDNVSLTMSKQFTQDDVRAVIRKEADETSMTKIALRIGVSVSLLSYILSGERGVSDAVAEAFGFEREIVTQVIFRKKAA